MKVSAITGYLFEAAFDLRGTTTLRILRKDVTRFFLLLSFSKMKERFMLIETTSRFLHEFFVL